MAIEQDVRALWSTGRFDDIRAESTADRDGISVIFRLLNAPEMQLHEIHIEPSSFGLQPKIAKGTLITRSRAFEIALEARKRLQAEGYVNARVDYDLLPFSGYKVDLRLTVYAGEPVNVIVSGLQSGSRERGREPPPLFVSLERIFRRRRPIVEYGDTRQGRQAQHCG
jgi:hypothetical protein